MPIHHPPRAAVDGTDAVADESGVRWIYGVQAVGQILRTHPERIRRILVQEKLGRGRRRRLASDLENRQCELITAPEAELARVSGSSHHQGVVAEVMLPGPIDEHEALETIERLDRPLILLLDSIQDPRNLGACLRTAEAAGADMVVVPRSRSTELTPAVSRTAAGAAELIPLARVANLARFMNSLGEVGLYRVGAHGEADRPLYEIDLNQPLALVMGSEGQGLRRLTRERCDALAYLPMLGAVGSLNVSVATGVFLYEALRQRGGQLAPPGGLS